VGAGLVAALAVYEFADEGLGFGEEDGAGGGAGGVDGAVELHAELVAAGVGPLVEDGADGGGLLAVHLGVSSGLAGEELEAALVVVVGAGAAVEFGHLGLDASLFDDEGVAGGQGLDLGVGQHVLADVVDLPAGDVAAHDLVDEPGFAFADLPHVDVEAALGGVANDESWSFWLPWRMIRPSRCSMSAGRQGQSRWWRATASLHLSSRRWGGCRVLACRGHWELPAGRQWAPHWRALRSVVRAEGSCGATCGHRPGVGGHLRVAHSGTRFLSVSGTSHGGRGRSASRSRGW
jgi:hypothetical protein